MCDCSAVNSCLLIDGSDKTIDGSNYSNVSLATTFPVDGVANGFWFDKDGIPSATGTATASAAGGSQGVVTVNVVGNVALTLP
jgi:hypothetical protein